MGLFLNPFELSEQKDRGILDRVLPSLPLRLRRLLGYQVGENGVIDGQPVDVIELLYKFEAHGAPHPPIPG